MEQSGQGGDVDSSGNGESRGGTDGSAGSGEAAGTGAAGTESNSATGGTNVDSGGGGAAALTGGATSTGGTLLTGGTAGTVGEQSTGGATTAGGSPNTGGLSDTGGSQGSGGTTTGGSGGTGGSEGCTGTETRGSCPANREVCSDGAWEPDLSCYSEACDLVACADGTSDCCLGWGRSGVDSSNDYQPSEAIVTSFSLEQDTDEYFDATFLFGNQNDVGAITLYLSEPVPRYAITRIDVEAWFTGEPAPWFEVSLEDGVDNLGFVWRWEELPDLSPETFTTPVDMYASAGCFANNACPTDTVDRLNIRLRPFGLTASDSGEAELKLYAVRLSMD